MAGTRISSGRRAAAPRALVASLTLRARAGERKSRRADVAVHENRLARERGAATEEIRTGRAWWGDAAINKGGKSMSVTRCPFCGGEVYETECVAVVRRGRGVQRTETVAAACSGCEFMLDLRRQDGVRKSAAQILRDVAVFLRRHRRALRQSISSV